MTPSPHLLRTLAAVAPGTRVVDLACGDGRHLEPLARLGFDVQGVTAGNPAPARARLADVLGEGDAHARIVPTTDDVPDASADWAVLSMTTDGTDWAALAEAARVLRPGGWVWVEVPPNAAAALADAARPLGLVEAESPGREGEAAHAIYRRPGAVV